MLEQLSGRWWQALSRIVAWGAPLCAVLVASLLAWTWWHPQTWWPGAAAAGSIAALALAGRVVTWSQQHAMPLSTAYQHQDFHYLMPRLALERARWVCWWLLVPLSLIAGVAHAHAVWWQDAPAHLLPFGLVTLCLATACAGGFVIGQPARIPGVDYL
jgi:hypothetical protein